MEVEIVSTPGSKRYNFAVIYGWWPERSLKAKGYRSGCTLYQRQATTEEKAEVDRSMRCLSFTYKLWSVLCSDECKFGFNAKYLAHKYRYGDIISYDPTFRFHHH